MSMVLEMSIVLIDKQHRRCACRMTSSHIINAVANLQQHQEDRIKFWIQVNQKDANLPLSNS